MASPFSGVSLTVCLITTVVLQHNHIEEVKHNLFIRPGYDTLATERVENRTSRA